ncbi:Phage P2 baseplate assembly protein gpV [Anaerobiospirillum thomasii]|uniref:Phage P2 baseplate assembly protein gpV n=1 Tax=Anaerobiospirillum thomasii TaxID=179995 RepID=A0A2X0V6P6_9GAMM|nr:phage baseplate assembly protein V [Anaerobiospirillum thomasii]SPT67654.1 Phage P2 baseplate assembly protein gpV [Anaerobiospirillum thomasii]SPT70114.1 Phage P2 baseplate assembly protein gpV [Anaerobiospirillum thomasii]
MSISALLRNDGYEELKHLLSMVIRVGEITSIDPFRHTARVVFPEDDNCTSYDLPILCPNTLKNHNYHMPDIGEDAVCLFRPDGIEDGFILGSFYAGDVKPPATDPDIRMVKFNDDTTVTYNRKTHELDIVIEGTKIHADRQTVDVTTPKTINLKSTDINIQASNTVNITGNSVVVGGNSTIVLSAPSVTVN